MLTIGLTGSRGFIGSAIFQKFISKYNIVVLDDMVKPGIKNVKIEVPEHLDWLLHFGESKSIIQSFYDPIAFYKKNLYSTLIAINIALKTHARLLFMSSYVYGNPRYLPIDEFHPVFVLNPYMGSKILCEQICFYFQQYFRLTVVILR